MEPISQAVVKPEDEYMGTSGASQLNSQTHIPRLQTVAESIATAKTEGIPDHASFASSTLFTPLGPGVHPPASSLAPNGSDPESRPLNVTDALSYLDAVKKQFEDRPNVYNNFLDIMKDFKSQAIDTPGVIERVSTLFRGHPDLIQGFNTFLPPGYRIDCRTDAMDSTYITVTTPSGITTQHSTDRVYPATLVDGPVQLPPASLPQPAALPATSHVPLPTLVGPASRADTPIIAGSPMPFGSSSAANWLGGLGGKGQQERQGQGPAGAEQFSHAIQYVNKIKTRFEDDTDTYKQFLDILHAYKKEQNHEDSQVYAQVYSQVQILFKDAPDLLAEFKDFLPAAGGSSGSADIPPRSPLPYKETAWQEDGKRPSRSDAVPAPKRKKRPEKEPAPPQPIAPAKTGSSRSKKVKQSHKADPGSPTFHAYHSRPPSPPQLHTHKSTHGQSAAHAHLSQQHGHGHGHVSHNHSHPSSSATQTASQGPTDFSPQDEFTFFDRVKKVLEPKETYDEWLKLLNLFTRDVIDARTLMQRAQSFLDGEFYAQFKEIMRWDEKVGTDDEGPPGSIRNWAVDWISRPGLDKEERYGKSYRRLPLAETQLACSGRDELCRSVLNDAWVSHPTWASEESGFVSHKKNSYEEALHKSEEERHEFQFYIDIITRTISLLQPISDRISEMNAEERHTFRLPADFGGSSKSIYHRAIKKVYGRDASGLEVLQALQECPAIAVPVVLPRLKQKNEEWRRAQRDWNRVWREVDARNFYKSLDHQGITFKANDKKYITTKSFVAEIEGAKSEMNERAAEIQDKASKSPESNSIPASLDSPCHLEFQFKDIAVLQDAMKLIFSFLDRSPIQYSSQERRTVERMLRSFIPLFCMIPASEFDAVFGPPLDGDGTDGEDAGNDEAGAGSAEEMDDIPSAPSKSHAKSGGSSGRRSAGGGSGGGGGGVHASDLRKKLLKTAQEKAVKARSGSASVSRAPSPTASDDCSSSSNVQQAAAAIARSSSPTSKKKKGGSKAKSVEDVVRKGECEEWVKLMPVAYNAGSGLVSGSGMESDDDAVSRLGKHGFIEQRPFFTNTTFYSLLRLLQLLYSRLLMCKEIGTQLASQSQKGSVFTVNPVADELGLVDASGPRAVLAVASLIPTAQQLTGGEASPLCANDADKMQVDTEDGKSASASNANPPPNAGVRGQDRPEAHFYGYLLDACEKLFEGEMDQATFEENMRFLFGTKAYNVFTLDKLIAALIKQVQTVVVDNKCQELLSLLTKTRAKQSSGTPVSVRELIAYRREAEQYLGQDDHLYRVEMQEDRAMKIWLLGSCDPSINTDIRPLHQPQISNTNPVGAQADGEKTGIDVARWRAYMESFVLLHPTELVGEGMRSKMQRTYLNRTREEVDDELPGATKPERTVVVTGLEVGIQPSTHKLVYRNGTEDVLYRWRTKEEEVEVQGRLIARGEERARRVKGWLAEQSIL